MLKNSFCLFQFVLTMQNIYFVSLKSTKINNFGKSLKMKIIPVYVNQQSNVNNQRIYQKLQINNVNLSINNDDFICITGKSQQQKFNPYFKGAIPEEKISEH